MEGLTPPRFSLSCPAFPGAPHRGLRPGGDLPALSSMWAAVAACEEEERECQRDGKESSILIPMSRCVPPRPGEGEVGCRIGIWGLSSTPSGILGGPQGRGRPLDLGVGEDLVPLGMGN